MNRVCLDTSAYSWFRRGNERLVAVLRAAEEVVVPVIVLGELRAGFRGGRHLERNERELAEFLAHPVVTTALVDDDASHHYARIVAVMREQGVRAATNDLWIAAVAASQGLVVVTCDGDFARIPVPTELVAP